MSDFFKSEIVRDELREINDLQEDLYVNVMKFGQMDKEQQLEHVDKLSRLFHVSLFILVVKQCECELLL